MSNIIITSSGRRVSLVNYFKKELKKIYPSGKVIALDSKINLSAAAQIADIALPISNVGNDKYISDLLNICLENDVKLVIPTIDAELEMMAQHRDAFKKQGVELLVSNSNFIDICNDKTKSHTFFIKNGIATPKIYSKENYKYPLFIKPKNGSSSVDNYLITESANFSKTYFDNNNLLFFEYIDTNLYDEFTCDAYYNNKGILKCVVPRKRIEVRGGEVNKGVTKRNELVEIIKDKLSEIPGARGCLAMQFFVHKKDKSIKGIEINARFGGGFPLSYLAGANYPKWILEEYLLKNDIDYFDTWEGDLLMLRYDAEILIHGHKV